ncbi:MAG: ATP-binding protein [Lachnospiraceae bacterium]|nr:ATP-binding protein [Lachnospiraceae bacterium]
MLIGRDSEINVLIEYKRRPGNQVMVMYGLKGVGKTSLVREFINDSGNSLVFDCKQLSTREQLYHWSHYGQLPFALPEYPEYADVFKGIEEFSSADSKTVLVFDEFQYLLKYDNEFTNNLFDFLASSSKNFLCLLISSSIEWVENSMVSKIGMRARGITGFFKVKELKFADFRTYFTGFGYDDCVNGYAILGGIPGLWKLFDKEKSLKDNIIQRILDVNGPLLNFGEDFVASELRETSVYNTILCALAKGYNKLNDLFAHTGFSRAKISVYIKNLMELGFVCKEFSVDTEGRSNTQKGVYDICCNYVDFSYQFLFNHKDELGTISPQEYYNKYIKPELSEYTARYFPAICKEYLDTQNQHRNLPITYNRVGAWIGKAGTIDFVCRDENDHVLIALCNWKKPMMRFEDYELLMYCAKQAKLKPDYVILFSSGGFDEELDFAVSSKKNIRLVTVDEL